MLTMWYLAILHHLGWAAGLWELPAVAARNRRNYQTKIAFKSNTSIHSSLFSVTDGLYLKNRAADPFFQAASRLCLACRRFATTVSLFPSSAVGIAAPPPLT